MFYWVLRSPPGYPPARALIVAAYRTPEPGSFVRTVGFAAGLDDARALIPESRIRLDRRPLDQFVELWGPDMTVERCRPDPA